MLYNPSIQFVVKISKFCNLRCSYCYEYNELGIRGTISQEEIKRFLLNIKNHILEHRSRTEFIWHGGEPFLVDLKTYTWIGEIQQKILLSCGEITNAVQTNLTVLTNRHIEFLKNNTFFQGIGVSFDVFGDQRVDNVGGLQTKKVLQNLQILFDHGISFGAICVLAQNTLPHVRQIYRFYDELGVSCRFLPIYRSAYPAQNEIHALTGKQVEYAFIQLYEEWSQSERATLVEPLNECLDYVVSYLQHRTENLHYYNKEYDEQVFIVNKDGSTWGVSETYEPMYRYGNVFDEDLNSILKSEGRKRAVQESQDRVEKHCTNCPYFGHCPGYFVGDATKQQILQIETDGCTIRNTMDNLAHDLEKQGILNSNLYQDHENSKRILPSSLPIL